MTRIRKISVSLEEFNRWLVSKGLKPLPENYQQHGVDPVKGDPNVFGSEPSITYAPAEPKAAEQPVWKWSWDPTKGLLIWAVDAQHGRPHHIEMTGPQFYNYAQGRVYKDGKGGYEILIWEDRASDEWQEEAAEDVQEWLLANTGQAASEVFWQGEGGYYPTIQDNNPDTDKMVEAYFQVDLSKMSPIKQDQYRWSYEELINPTKSDAGAFDPVDEHRKNDEKWLRELGQGQQLDQEWQQAYRTDASTTNDSCPTCGGEGTDISGHLCLTCKGNGTDPRLAIKS